MPLTLYDKIYQEHLVNPDDKEAPLLYIDSHLIFEVPTAQAFDGLRKNNRPVRRTDLTLATVDHNVPTDDRSKYQDAVSFVKEPQARTQITLLEKNIKEHDIRYFGMSDRRQGIVHVVGPEQGLTLPGSTLFCGDSHTPTHGAVGALAVSGGTSDIEHVLATQTVLQKKYKNFRVRVEGELRLGVYSKDIILHLLGKIGTAGATGCVIEFCGSTIRNLSMEARMVLCNMSIEGGARTGLVAPDEVTFEYLKGRPLVPSGAEWDKAMAYWKTLYSDEYARWDFSVDIDAADIAPSITWGTSPDDVIPITGHLPDPTDFDKEEPLKAAAIRRALKYMDLKPKTPATDIKIDRVFIGSCTNSRIEDLRAAARVARGRKVADSVYAMVVPGSGLVKQQAESEGLDVILKAAGFDWREAGCSMCLAMNPDVLTPGERCASTTNRNFEGRQGPGGRTHLVSPAMAAAAAIKGHLTDVREFLTTGNGSIAVTQLTLEGDKVSSYGKVASSASAPDSESLNGTVAKRPAEQAKRSVEGIPKFDVLHSVPAPFNMRNINTDLVIPGDFLKTTKRTGLGPHLFQELRYDSTTHEEIPDFVLNQEPYRQSRILVCTGENFGCGSSREHAVWALVDFGIRCVIAPSFASIFFNNSGKNGLLAIPLDDSAAVEKIHAEGLAKREVKVDLPNQEIRDADGNLIASFKVDAYTKHCLLNGLDDISNTLMSEEKIYEFETKQQTKFPWLFGRIRKLQSPRRLGLHLPGAQDVFDW
ncbi:3-isopropylmalate dehydratase, large subunit [Cladophialophora carrionii CBS 160.54]|uniref:3-isopropylmalate dehydratase n=1 Tax=Cladophialophora carrionii CBS 160.54 TaxID=1279043 RepID=V9DFU2_9EURO|nr:3-isopropylmalate dehydratase, large subunit [Cladophialophora carrionii CBS 160.54]ETI25526.1 3-isopropylmalate dehydratase, large subunit [Cladophialophora carrionii CBS 160.54]